MDYMRRDEDHAEADEKEQMDVESVFRVIFVSCDVDNTDLVNVSKLIEFVKPFMNEDLNALEDLRHSLDPEGKNILVNSERFYQVMALWSQKISATAAHEENEFDQSPNQLQPIDPNELPYTHSTPRASLGDKLLKCKDLLNLSNVSGYSLSTSRLDTTNSAALDKEEEIKKLEHQLLKTTNELHVIKQQLTISEDQNETLQQDLERLNRRLHAEQQVNEHLQKEKMLSEELREELNNCKKVIDALKKKLSQSEKDNKYHKECVEDQHEERLKLEKKIELVTKQHQDCVKEIFDIKTELDTKEDQMSDVMKVYNELKVKFAEQKDFNDQLREENDILSHQKSTLERALKVKSFDSPHSNLGNLNLDLPNTPSNTQNIYSPISSSTSPIYTHHTPIQPKCQSIPLVRRALARHSSTPVNAMLLLDNSLPEGIRRLPTLSPNHRGNQDERTDRQDSSEEDLYWKLHQGEDAKLNEQLNGTNESLHAEMNRANSARAHTSYHTALFEKDEHIIELEEELEKVKNYLKEIEDQNNEFLTSLKDQKKINEELLESNFVLVAKEENSLSKINSLKNKIALLEKNGIIVENDHEISQGEFEDLRSKIKALEGGDLVEKLRHAESLIEDYDQRLQATMRDLGEELCELKEQNRKKDQEIEKCRNDMKEMVLGFEKTLKSKAEELNHCKNQQQQKDEELELFKDNLEKKIVGEFEGKVKYSMEAEEKLLNLTTKCNQLEEDLKNTLSKLSSKSRVLADSENKIKKLSTLETSLKLTITNLEVSNAEFKSTVVNLKTENNDLLAKLEQINKVEVVASEIQQHIRDKDVVIGQLKQLNKKMEFNLNEAQLDLRGKINDILKLRNEWCQDIDIKNKLWTNIKTLQRDNDHLNAINTELLQKERQLTISGETVDIEYSNLLILYDLEVEKNSKLDQKIAELVEEKSHYRSKYDELRKQFDNIAESNAELREKLEAQELQEKIQKNDSMSQTVAVDIQTFEEEFSKIKIESDKLLEELESRLNDEVHKNRDLTNNLLEMKKHLNSSNDELLEIKQKVTNNEIEMVAKLQDSIENNKKLAEELFQTKESLQTKDVELKKLVNRVNETEQELILLREKNVMLTQELVSKCEEVDHQKRLKKNHEKKMRLEYEESNMELSNRLANSDSLLEQRQRELIDLTTELDLFKQENDKINNELFDAASEISLLGTKMSELENQYHTLLKESRIEMSQIENRNGQLENDLLRTKQERDALNNKLHDEVLKVNQLKEKLCVLGEMDQIRLEETKLKLQEEIAKNKAIFEKYSILKEERDLVILELKDIKASLSNTKALYNKKQVELAEMKKEGVRSLENEKSESFNSSGSSCSSNIEKESKRKTYSRQQIAIDKLKDKLDDAENELKMEKSKNRELKAQLVLLEGKIALENKEITISSEEKREVRDENKIRCEGRTINKFTIAARCTASPDSPSTDIEVKGLDNSRKSTLLTKYPFIANCDSTIEIPSLDINCANEIIEELELNEGSPRKKLNRDEIEKHVTALTLRLVVSSNTISQRIESETEKYRSEYEEILNLIRDVSCRLRDHVCIGTAEPIMPVFVLLEDIKLQLKELVQTAGQVGVLIYEDRMKKCWNLVTNYMATLRQENESFHNASRRRISCSRLTATVLFVLGFALIISIIIHLNCRMTASDNQYCPLDGIITRINVGIPPM